MEWIPTSVRMPSEQGQYLVTFPLYNGEPWVYILSFNKGKFYETDDEWGDVEYDDVTAWMPLPKPYTADTPQTDKVVCPNCGRSDYIRSFEKDFGIKNSEYRYKCINCNTYIKDTPQTESTGSPIGDYRDGVGAWQTDCGWK